MFAGKKSAQIREILISESAWEEMTCLFAPSLVETAGWPTTITNDGIYDAHDGVGIADIHIGSLSVINTSWGLIPAAINEGATGNTTQVAIGEYFALLVYGNYFSLEIGQ
ncbi:hypothetical protein R1TS_22070 [Enterobacter cloacae]|nr:hypothetical protein R1TS_22070 [Enterobacter cloacae]